MGLSSHALSDLPTRPKFKRDMRSCPWTDWKGNQEQFVIQVRRWSKYHDALPDNNSNKIPAELRGLTLLAQLFDCAIDLCRAISDDVIGSAAGVDEIFKALHKRDELSVVSALLEDFGKLLQFKRTKHES